MCQNYYQTAVIGFVIKTIQNAVSWTLVLVLLHLFQKIFKRERKSKTYTLKPD